MSELLDDGDLEMVELGADEELLRVLQDIGNNDTISVKVYRARKGSKNTAFLYECMPGDFSLAYIRDNYGSGDYRVQVRDGSKLVQNKLISIEALPQLPQAQRPPESENFQKLLEMMQEQSKEQKTDMQTMFDANMKMMMLMMGQRPQGMQMTDMVQMLSSLAGIFKGGFGGSAPATSPETMLNMFMQGMNMAREMSPPPVGADTTDLLMKMVDQFGPIFTQAFTGMPVPGGVATPAFGSPKPHALVEHATRPAIPGQTVDNVHTSGKGEADMIQAMLRPKLRELCEVAARAGNIDLYTDLVLDQVPMPYISMLLRQPDPLQFLASVEPSISNFTPWFKALLANIKAVLEEEASLTPDGDGASSPESADHGSGNVITPDFAGHGGQEPDGDGKGNSDT